MYIFVKKIVIKIFYKNIIFIIPYFIFVVLASIILLIYEKPEIHIFINSSHNSFYDFFFKYWTYQGHGIFALLITVLLLFIRYKWAIISAISNILTAFTVQLLKRYIFTESYRPAFYFKYFYSGDYNLYFVNGIEPGSLHSFPSGHSATAFAVFFLLSIIVKEKYLKLIFFFIALLVAYSRIYLSWHFLEDIFAGSLIGIIITLITYLIINRSKALWFNNSIINKNKKTD